MTEAEFEKLLKKTVSPGKVRESLVGSEYLSDVTFTLGDRGEELKAHKFFLMTASPVFHEIFSDDTHDDIKIEGISKETMTEICRFAYTEQLKLTSQNMLPIMFAASKLQMKFLFEKTVNFICKEGMNEHTVFLILAANKKDSNMVINMKCFAYIEKNHQKCLKSNDFLSLESDAFRMILQACKLPLTAAKEAIALWSSQGDNKDEDLDELIALVSLNDDVPEIPAAVTDTESSPSVQSRSRSVGQHPNQKFNKNHHNKKFFNSNQSLDQPQQFRQHQKPFNQKGNQGFHDATGAHRDMIQRQQLQQQHSQYPIKNIFFIGQVVRKNRKFSNLDLAISATPIAIHALHFIYDLRTTDKFFEIRIVDVTKQKVDLFYDRVETSNQREPFFRYVLPRPCQLAPGSKVWISLEFDRSDHRLSFDDFIVANTSEMNRVELRSSHSAQPHAQIISTIVFADY